MSEFIQLHMLTNYAPSNLNRDDLGRPKTAKMGGVDRLRISSQSLKRAWRMSEFFNGLKGNRTKRVGLDWIYPLLVEKGIEEDVAKEWSTEIQLIFGEPEDASEDKPDHDLLNKQLVFISSEEKAALDYYCLEVVEFLKTGEDEEGFFNKLEKARKQKDKKKRRGALRKLMEDKVLSLVNLTVDIALFGRMLASSPKYNVEAAAQVAHAITVNRVAVEDDYFTAVDDLNTHEEDAGSAHIGESGFGSGVFYTYICINKTLLIDNLGSEELANSALKALVEAAATVAPSGKQNSFASRARAHYLMAEKGSQQPRQLSSAFLKPVDNVEMVRVAVERLETLRDNMDKAYGKCADDKKIMDVEKGEGSLTGILEFVGA